MDSIKLEVDPGHIDLLTRLIEAWGHLGVVSTLDRRQGLVIIRATEDTVPEITKILAALPFPIQLLAEE